MLKTNQLVLSLIFTFLTKNISSTPTCNPSENSTISWATCPHGLDPNAWYGLTNVEYDFVAAAEYCKSQGAELVSVTSQDIDVCLSITLNSNSVQDEMVLYAGRYFSVFGNWAWCPGSYCTSDFDYTIGFSA